ncbi:MAG: type IV pilus modification protein PilV [Burkholderiaceae bacterium]|jgi:type IV pilus assembly protein PilV|nr:type IV pilus modification protein PilV [Burkholderiaceae bacterium]
MNNHDLSRMGGFSLLEALIAVVILSFGLLGALRQQAVSLKFTRDARLQSVAVGFGRELGEMMRTNARIAAQTRNPYLGAFADGSLTPERASGCLDSGQSCAAPADVASAQMTDWLARVDDALPGARVTVCADSSPYDEQGLPVWDCAGAPAASPSAAYIKIGWTRQDTRGSIVAASDAAARPFVVFPVALDP